jgi:hypothetical protein
LNPSNAESTNLFAVSSKMEDVDVSGLNTLSILSFNEYYYKYTELESFSSLLVNHHLIMSMLPQLVPIVLFLFPGERLDPQGHMDPIGELVGTVSLTGFNQVL